MCKMACWGQGGYLGGWLTWVLKGLKPGSFKASQWGKKWVWLTVEKSLTLINTALLRHVFISIIPLSLLFYTLCHSLSYSAIPLLKILAYLSHQIAKHLKKLTLGVERWLVKREQTDSWREGSPSGKKVHWPNGESVWTAEQRKSPTDNNLVCLALWGYEG